MESVVGGEEVQGCVAISHVTADPIKSARIHGLCLTRICSAMMTLGNHLYDYMYMHSLLLQYHTPCRVALLFLECALEF